MYVHNSLHYMQDNHAHPVAPNLKEEKKTVSDTVLRQKLLIVTLSTNETYLEAA